MAYQPDHEAGFTLVELVVVVLIIAVMIGFAVTTVGSARASGHRAEVRAAASRYADAIERYQADNGRRVPVLGSAQWPSDAASLGPTRRIVMNGETVSMTRYLTGSPPDIAVRTRGQTGQGGAIFASAPRASGPTLIYVAEPGGLAYELIAYWDGVAVCSSGREPARPRRC